jgi:hypothetical protein
MEKVVKAQGVLVASLLLALASLPAVAVPANGHLAVPASLAPGTHCDCETR